jgi:hypothetical protein
MRPRAVDDANEKVRFGKCCALVGRMLAAASMGFRPTIVFVGVCPALAYGEYVAVDFTSNPPPPKDREDVIAFVTMTGAIATARMTGAGFDPARLPDQKKMVFLRATKLLDARQSASLLMVETLMALRTNGKFHIPDDWFEKVSDHD